MAFKLAEAFVQLSVNGMESVAASINGLRGGLNRLGQVNFGGRLAAGMGHVSAGMRQLASQATSLPGMLAVTGVLALGKHAVQLAMDMEQAVVSFKVMLGSAADAKKLMGEIMQFAAETPYESPEVVNATKSLIAFGSSASTVIDEIRRLGDIASGVGMPIGELAQIYGKARVQGRLFAEDMNQLTGRGIPIIGEIAKQLGISQSEVRKAVEKGQVNFENIETAFKSLTDTGGRFHDMMDAQSKTMAGIASTAKDDINAALRDMGKIIGESVVPAFAQSAKDANAIADAVFRANSGEKPELGSSRAATEQAAIGAAEAKTGSVDELKKRRAELQKQRDAEMAKFTAGQARLRGRSQWNPLNWLPSMADARQIDEARAAAKSLDMSLSVIDAQINRLDRSGKKSIAGVTNGFSMANRAVNAFGSSVSRAVSAMTDRMGGVDLGKAFGYGSHVKSGQAGYVEEKRATAMADRAIANANAKYKRANAELNRLRKSGAISEGTFRDKVDEAKAARDSVVKVAEEKKATKQYVTFVEQKKAVERQYQRQLDAINDAVKRGQRSQLSAAAATVAANNNRLKQLREIAKAEQQAANAAKQSRSASGNWAALFGVNQAQIALERHQSQVQRANKISAEAKKLFDEATTPAERYQKRVKELDKMRADGNGISQQTYDRLKAKADEEFASQFHGESNATKKHVRQMEDLDRWRKDRDAHDTKQFKGKPDELAKRRKETAGEFARLKKKADDELAQNLGEEKPEFKTKVGQVGNENRLYDERRKELDAQRGKLGEERYGEMVKRLDTAHKYRLADIDDAHKKGTESHGLTEFAKHIQASLHKAPEEARREQREKDMLKALQAVAKNTNPANQNNAATVARGGP